MNRFELLVEAARLTAKVDEVATQTTFTRIKSVIGARICDARMLAAAGDMDAAETGIKEAATLLDVVPLILLRKRTNGPVSGFELKDLGCSIDLFIEFLNELELGYSKGRGPCAGMIFLV